MVSSKVKQELKQGPVLFAEAQRLGEECREERACGSASFSVLKSLPEGVAAKFTGSRGESSSCLSFRLAELAMITSGGSVLLELLQETQLLSAVRTGTWGLIIFSDQ